MQEWTAVSFKTNGLRPIPVQIPWAVVGLMISRYLAAYQLGHIEGVAISVCALAEVARFLRFLLIPLALTLLVVPFVYDAHLVGVISGVVCALLLIGLSSKGAN